MRQADSKLVAALRQMIKDGEQGGLYDAERQHAFYERGGYVGPLGEDRVQIVEHEWIINASGIRGMRAKSSEDNEDD